jgi:gliding motility-associated-like protein
VVFKLPELVIQEEHVICLNTFPSPITLDAGVINGFTPTLFYDWSTGETTPEIQVNTPGIYTVTVSNTNGCSTLRTITVPPSNIATFDSIEIVDGVENNTVTVFVSGEGEYEYALDSEFTGYQDSNVFSEVTPGYHTVYVRDKNDCGTVKENIAIIGFPKFFTPNGDGYNDTWQVYGINTPDQVYSEISIFDRFGKLLIKLSPSSAGWDGTFNGVNTPSSDYWFSIKLQNNKIFRGHFSLRR